MASRLAKKRTLAGVWFSSGLAAAYGLAFRVFPDPPQILGLLFGLLALLAGAFAFSKVNEDLSLGSVPVVVGLTVLAAWRMGEGAADAFTQLCLCLFLFPGFWYSGLRGSLRSSIFAARDGLQKTLRFASRVTMGFLVILAVLAFVAPENYYRIYNVFAAVTMVGGVAVWLIVTAYGVVDLRLMLPMGWIGGFPLSLVIEDWFFGSPYRSAFSVWGDVFIPAAWCGLGLILFSLVGGLALRYLADIEVYDRSRSEEY